MIESRFSLSRNSDQTLRVEIETPESLGGNAILADFPTDGDIDTTAIDRQFNHQLDDRCPYKPMGCPGEFDSSEFDSDPSLIWLNCLNQFCLFRQNDRGTSSSNN